MTDFNYAHNDTSGGERTSVTAEFNKFKCGELIRELRAQAFSRQIPTADDETLNFICALARLKNAQNILELGTAVGISGLCLLESCPAARLVTVERDEEFYKLALENFKRAGADSRVQAVLGDAGEVIQNLKEDAFDFIFMDCAKVQYVKYLPRLKKLLKQGGALIADDVLLYGWVTGEVPVPPKRKMLVRHIREYIAAVTDDNELETAVLNIGDGVALSVKL